MLFFFFFYLNKHHCSCFHTAPGGFREEVCVARPLSLSYLWLPPSPLPRVRMSFNFASSLGQVVLVFFCVVFSLFWAYKGNKVFSWVARIAYMERRVRSPISDSKLACGIEQGKGGGWGIGATNGIWWYPKRLNSRLSLPAHIKSIFIKRKQKTFFFSFIFFFSN